jgi:hypothetical protein
MRRWTIDRSDAVRRIAQQQQITAANRRKYGVEPRRHPVAGPP